MSDERGVCANCGGDMDFSPFHPWCPDCDFEQDAMYERGDGTTTAEKVDEAFPDKFDDQ